MNPLWIQTDIDICDIDGKEYREIETSIDKEREKD